MSTLLNTYTALVGSTATHFRSAIESAQSDGVFTYDVGPDGYRRPGLMSRFPADCCDSASWLLHRFILEVLSLDSVCVIGAYQRDEKPTEYHSWLRLKDGLVIDITGDQFRNRREFGCFNRPVFCGYDYPLSDYFDNQKTEFVVDFSNPGADFGVNGGRPDLVRLDCWYSRIIEHLE